MTSSALRPTEPVAPSTTTFVTLAPGSIRIPGSSPCSVRRHANEG
jgi:hypothetical protein